MFTECSVYTVQCLQNAVERTILYVYTLCKQITPPVPRGWQVVWGHGAAASSFFFFRPTDKMCNRHLRTLEWHEKIKDFWKVPRLLKAELLSDHWWGMRPCTILLNKTWESIPWGDFFTQPHWRIVIFCKGRKAAFLNIRFIGTLSLEAAWAAAVQI